MKKLSEFNVAVATNRNIRTLKANPPRYPRYIYLLNEIVRFRNILYALKY